MRKSSTYLLYVAINSIILCLLFGHAASARKASSQALIETGGLVKRLELTDLCLFTDARYARNPAVADMNSAFQDSPMAFEHFPSGSLIHPPAHLKRAHGTY